MDFTTGLINLSAEVRPIVPVLSRRAAPSRVFGKLPERINADIKRRRKVAHPREIKPQSLIPDDHRAVIVGMFGRKSAGRKVAGGFTAHSLRHTFITHLLNSGVEVTTVMELSGHKSYQSFSVYLHATPRGLLAARRVLDSVDGLLTGDEVKGVKSGEEEIAGASPKPLKKQQLAPAAKVRRNDP